LSNGVETIIVASVNDTHVWDREKLAADILELVRKRLDSGCKLFIKDVEVID
jgi:hypothetical protein